MELVVQTRNRHSLTSILQVSYRMLANPHKYVSLNIIFFTLFVFNVEIATSPLSAEREAFEELLILLDIFRQTACDHSYQK